MQGILATAADPPDTSTTTITLSSPLEVQEGVQAVVQRAVVPQDRRPKVPRPQPQQLPQAVVDGVEGGAAGGIREVGVVGREEGEEGAGRHAVRLYRCVRARPRLQHLLRFAAACACSRLCFLQQLGCEDVVVTVSW